MIRDDLSSKLVHLTRGSTDDAAASAFRSIMEQKVLRGSSIGIRGGYQCVCFSEAPISKLATILATPNAQGMRYKPFGIMLDKAWLFDRGGRPVIYQTDLEFDLLPEELKHRHVRYEPRKVDFTWEREWRVCTSELTFTPEDVTLVVPNRRWAEWAINKHISEPSAYSLFMSGTGLPSVEDFPWHFAALEDLGVEIPTTASPP